MDVARDVSATAAATAAAVAVGVAALGVSSGTRASEPAVPLLLAVLVGAAAVAVVALGSRKRERRVVGAGLLAMMPPAWTAAVGVALAVSSDVSALSGAWLATAIPSVLALAPFVVGWHEPGRARLLLPVLLMAAGVTVGVVWPDVVPFGADDGCGAPAVVCPG